MARPTERRVLLNTLSNFTGNFVSMAGWLLVTPFILRQVGDTDFGLWMLVSSVTSYGTLLDFGVAGAITKYIAEYRATRQIEQAHILTATSLSIYSVTGLIVVLVCAVIAPALPALFNIPPEKHTLAVWLVFLSGLNVGISIPGAMAAAVLRGLQRFDLINLINIAGTLLQLTAFVAVLQMGAGILALAAIAAAVRLLKQIPSVWCIYRIAPELRFGWRGAQVQAVRTVISFSWPVFVVDVGGRLETETGAAVIGAFLPVSAVAPYSAIQKLCTIPQTAADQFLRLLLPMASELHAHQDLPRLRSLYTASTRITVAVFVSIGCSLVVFARSVLDIWLGAAYADYSQLVFILVFAGLMDIILWPAWFVLQGMARHRLPAVMSIVSGLTNLILSIVLIRHWGLTGVALATLVPTTLVGLGIVLPYALRTIQVKARTIITQAFLPAVLPAIPMVVAITVLGRAIEPSSLFALAIVTGIGFLIYLIGYLNMRASTIERQIFHRTLTKAIHLVRTGSDGSWPKI